MKGEKLEYIHIIGAWSWWFFSLAYNVKIHVLVHFTIASQFCVNIIVLCETESSIPRAS